MYIKLRNSSENAARTIKIFFAADNVIAKAEYATQAQNALPNTENTAATA